MINDITIIICTYNRASQLDATLKSISSQIVPDYVQWQVLVVNNNCTDHTLGVFDNYQHKINNLEMVYETRQGLTEARQCGVTNAKTEWIAFVDDDCILARDWIDCTMKFININHKVAGFVGKNTLEFKTTKPAYVHPTMFAGYDPGGTTPTRINGALYGAGLVLARSKVLSSGWLDRPICGDRRGKSLLSGGDNELSLRAASQGGGLWFVPSCRISHVIPDDRISIKYLLKLNYGLAEPIPILSLLTNKDSSRAWLKLSCKKCLLNFLKLFGLTNILELTPDPFLSNSSGLYSRTLFAARSLGYSNGLLKAWLRLRREPDLNGLAVDKQELGTYAHDR